MPSSDDGAEVLRNRALNSEPWMRSLTHSPEAVSHSPAEIDAACELIDFLRFNVAYGEQICAEQPTNPSPGWWNRLDARPLEGFVFAVPPFNFTAIAGNLPTAPAIMGNTVVWKPASSLVYTPWLFMQILEEAGLRGMGLGLLWRMHWKLSPFRLPRQWVDFAGSQIGVRRDLAESRGVEVERAVEVVREYLSKQEAIEHVWTREEIETGTSEVARLYRNSYDPERSGDLIVQLAPTCLISFYDSGTTHEQVHDVALSDGRQVDPETGRAPPVGTTVDVADASYTNDIGAATLSVVWTDPNFSPTQRAFYYARIIEIPTPRWTAYDAKHFNLDLPDEVPMVVQDRAYSSPIWYTP